MSKLTLPLIASLFLLSPSSRLLSQSSETLPASIAAPSQNGIPVDPPDPAMSSNEKWDKLSLAESNLKADFPVPGEVDTYPDFTRELLRVQWRGGDPIDLYLLRPVGIAKPPVILYLYSYPEEGARLLNDNLCRTLTRNGFAAIGFSSMLTGQRYHDVPMKEWFVSDLQQSLVGTAHDVQMILDFLASRGNFDMTRVGMFGAGSGGTIALLAASVDPRIKAVDVLDPWGDWPDWLRTSPLVPDTERPDYLKSDFLEPLVPLDPLTVLPRFKSTPLRLQQTLFDETVTPLDIKKRIVDAAPSNAEVARYKDKQEYLEKVGSNGKMLDWMYARLKPSSETSNR